MKTKLLFGLLFASSVFLFSCGDRCWKCKTWNLSPNGSGWTYVGEDELCSITNKKIKELDYLENDSTDGWECEVFYK